jgi:hypothetical protein
MAALGAEMSSSRARHLGARAARRRTRTRESQDEENANRGTNDDAGQGSREQNVGK